MLQKFLYFIKYNNATVIILAIILVLGGGAFAAGPEVIGEKQTSVQGLDNTALLAADLDKFNMDFKIENIEQDDKYFYVSYSFLDLVKNNSAWQYQLSQRTQKVSKKVKLDLGQYLAKFLVKHYEARIRELKQEKNQTQKEGEQRRVEVSEYSGLIGRTLNLAAKVFPGYEPVVKRELPAPENFKLPESLAASAAPISQGADNLTRIYNDYMAEHPDLLNSLSADASSTPPAIAVSSPDSASTTDQANIVSESPAIAEPLEVNVIELPAAEPVPVENAPAEVEPAPAQ